ncbi:hypothetical protein BDZ94DRAFT_1292511 [Collybia nuda]|uniref:RhoGAP-domain-containing protein n=1 Tax=Collybia nuda TaxID=64659 RepID=A0A9P5XWW6_9AGAR|nr:hypothetical protein BDZ94DRAFT_1292511 [Collybia nuda]
MSFNAASAASIYGTPSRSERLPFPHSSQPSPAQTPQRQLAISAASTSSSTIPTSSSSTPSVNKDRPVTTASLLKLYAGSADPKAAALEHSVADRNVLCAQNAQLWKLIEKQRSGYNQILKELERVRGERDGLKSKLGISNTSSTANNAGHGEKRHRTSEDRSAQRSFSENSSTVSLQSLPSNGDPRQTMSRHYSDDIPTPRSGHHSLHPSRSHDPLSPRERDPTFQTNLSQHSSPNFAPSQSQTLPPPPSSAPSALGNPAIPQLHLNQSTRSHKHSPAPLIVPPRAENLPFPASAVSATQETNPYGHIQSSYPQDASVNLSNNVVNGDSTIPQTRSSAYPRKSSLADSISSSFSTNAGGSSNPTTALNNSNYEPSITTLPYTSSARTSQHNGGLTPQTAPAGFGEPLADQYQSLQRSATTPQIQSQPYPQILTPTPTTAGLPQIVTTATANNGMLSTIPEGPRAQLLSRDSRISLPDEARQYIANMTDSPAPSPRADAFVARFAGSRMLQPQVAIPENVGSLVPPAAGTVGEADSPGGASEFLDMGEEEDDEDDGQGSAITGPEADTETEYEVVDTPSPQEGPQRQSSPEDSLHLQTQGRKSKSRAVVEDFPLPPPGPPISGQQIATQSVVQPPQMYAQPQHLSSDLVLQQTPPPGYASSGHLSSLENPYLPPGQYQPNTSTQSLRVEAEKSQQQQSSIQSVPASFRELPLLSSDLPYTTITVSHSFVRPNDRGKEVLSFVVFVNPGHGKEGWKVEKMYSDVLGLDQRVRSSVGKGVGKKIANLPEGKLWKDHAPAKVDQRKAVLENYLQTLINLPIKNNNEVIAFFTSDIMREAKQPVMQVGHKEGYLTKRGKNFGGWKTRYFVLQGPMLEYYDCRGGAHLGSILVTGAQIGRQQRSERAPTTDEEKEYRHAFLIVEAKKGPGGNHPRHVLCAESDEDRDSWVEILVRYFSGTYSEEPVKYGPSPISINTTHHSAAQPRSSTSSHDSPSSRRPIRGLSKDDISISKGAAIPISQLPPDYTNTKLFQSAPVLTDNFNRSASPAKSVEPSPIDHQGANSNFDTQNINARRILERGQGQPSSLPDSSPLSAASNFPIEPPNNTLGQRANSELGHYPDLQDLRAGRSNRQVSPERHRTRDPHDGRKSFYPTLNTVASSPTTASPVDRIPSPDKLDVNGKSKVISGPINGAPIPSGFKFGGKDAPSASESTAAERREKAKSRSFWGFGKVNGEKANHPVVTYTPRAVFGVTLDEALDVAQIANLPAIVFRSIQYLEAKKADQEEGIYRLSGSSAVIKSLKDRFNMEGDVDLLASDEYWDPHAIAGLLKSFLRELPASILTRDLHLKFLAVIDFVDAQERIRELSQLIAALPIANYSLLRALTAHLILIVQNSSVNKMTMRNVGIVFSPTLGIPAGVFSLMLGEFNRVFNVDAEEASDAGGHGNGDGVSDLHRRNSRQYSDAAADQLLGLTGRSLKTSADETPSDGDDISIHDESGAETTDGDFTVESSSESNLGPGKQHNDHAIRVTPPDTPVALKMSKASNTAATRGLNVSITQSDRGNRHSRMMGLPTSPRPPHSPSQPDLPSSPAHSKE